MIGDEQLTELYNKEFESLKKFCADKLGSNTNAEDLAQQTFLKIRDMDLKEVKSISKWLRGVARNLCREDMRRRSKERDAAVMFTLLTHRSPPKEQHSRIQILKRLIRNLPKQYSKALQYVYLDGVPQKKAAEKMKMPYNKFRMVLTRGRNRLSEMFKSLEDLE